MRPLCVCVGVRVSVRVSVYVQVRTGEPVRNALRFMPRLCISLFPSLFPCVCEKETVRNVLRLMVCRHSLSPPPLSLCASVCVFTCV